MEGDETMEWRISERNNSFYAEWGMDNTEERRCFCTMPACIEYESARFDTKRQAEKEIDRNKKRHLA